MGIELFENVADQFQVGRSLPYCVRDEAGQLLLVQGSVLSSAAQIELLARRAAYVEFDEPDEPPDPPDAAPRTLFERWARLPRQLDRVLATLGQPGFAARCNGLADDLVALTERDPDIAIYAAVRQDSRDLIRYGLNHAVHSAMLAHLAATRLGWPAARVRSLVNAALTMNLAIVDVQGLAARIGRLNEGQRERLRNHPHTAWQRLREAGVDDGDWLAAVRDHHERDGGGGYPSGLAQPHALAVALRMVDTFLSKISERAVRPAMTVQQAAKQLFEAWRTHPLAAAIIKEFGILPPGHFVQLASGELAVVIRRGASAHAPLAAAVTDGRGRPVVTTHRRNTGEPGFAVKGLTPDTRTLDRVPPERLYGIVC